MTRAVLTALMLLGTSLFSSGQKEGPPKIEGKPSVTADGLKIWDVKVGEGDKAIGGMDVTVHYTAGSPAVRSSIAQLIAVSPLPSALPGIRSSRAGTKVWWA